MKIVLLSVISIMIFTGCASKEFDQKSYDRQNKAAEKSLNKLEN